MRAGEVAIRAAATPADYRAFARLLGDYLAWCRIRYGDEPGFVDRVFGHQSFDDEVPVLATRYGPPEGRALIAVEGDDIGGIGAWRRLADGSCEMKRVFVVDRWQGRGVGRRLCEALIADARDAGFGLVRIDTLDRFTEALAMYGSLGFRRCAPHQAYPPDLAGRLVFSQLSLEAGRRQGD